MYISGKRCSTLDTNDHRDGLLREWLRQIARIPAGEDYSRKHDPDFFQGHAQPSFSFFIFSPADAARALVSWSAGLHSDFRCERLHRA